MDETTRVLAKTAIRRARNLLSDPKRWTKGTDAYSINSGLGADPKGEEACQWCLRGALRAVALNGDYGPASEAVLQVVRDKGHTSIPGFNDRYNTTHADVLRVLDEADARL
jgi:hypothetical protein